jgi:hypothetical protein
MLMYPIVIAAALHASPIADNVPNLNVARECQAEVDNQQSQKSCIDDENRMRQQLEKEWQSFDAVDRRQCGQEAAMGGASSYAEFLTCLEMAQDTRNNQNAQNQATQTQGSAKARK